MKKLIVIAAVLLGITTTSFAQLSDVASSKATIVADLSVSKQTDLDFGSIYANAAAGTVIKTANAAGVRTLTGGVHLGSDNGSTASFLISGSNTDQIMVSYPSTITLTKSAGVTMSYIPAGSVASGSKITLAGGTATLWIGGTLAVAQNQVAGVYSNASDLKVTVTYP